MFPVTPCRGSIARYQHTRDLCDAYTGGCDCTLRAVIVCYSPPLACLADRVHAQRRDLTSGDSGPKFNGTTPELLDSHRILDGIASRRRRCGAGGAGSRTGRVDDGGDILSAFRAG